MIDESVKMEASSNNTVNFAEGFKSQVIPSLKTALLNPSSEQVKFWTSYYSKPSPKNIWNYLIAGPRPCLPVWKRTEKFNPFNCCHLSMGDQSSYVQSTYIKYKSIANEPAKPLSPFHKFQLRDLMEDAVENFYICLPSLSVQQVTAYINSKVRTVFESYLLTQPINPQIKHSHFYFWFCRWVWLR